MISTDILSTAGYDLSQATQQVRIVTAQSTAIVPRLTVTQIDALGQTHTEMSILGYTVPAAATVDGLLGLDFLHERTLTIDFRTGLFTLA